MQRCGRLRVQKEGTGRRVTVNAILLGQKADDGEEIAQYAHASLGGGATGGKSRRVGRTFSHGTEDIQFNRGAKRCGPLMGQQCVKN